MSLPASAVLAALEGLAPLALAASWDNVGLLVPPLAAEVPVETVLLAIDLTEAVLDEAIACGASFVVAYHPPLFSGIKRFDPGVARDRTILRAIREGIALYAPHTALDAVEGGMNDWIVEGLGPVASSVPIAPEPGRPTAGPGRLALLSPPAVLDVVVDRLKDQLRLKRVRVAAAPAHVGGVPIERVAVCAGAGGSLFADVAAADLFVTGEMRHHDVLARVEAGASVILCDHTNTERGYLPRLGHRLDERLGGAVQICVSARDVEPLAIV